MDNDNAAGVDLLRNQGRIDILKRLLDGEDIEGEYARYRTRHQ